MTFQDALKILTNTETTGAGFWNRNSDDSISIWIRGAHGNDPTQWDNARQLENAFGNRVISGITPDPQSGHLLLRIRAKDWYTK